MKPKKDVKENLDYYLAAERYERGGSAAVIDWILDDEERAKLYPFGPCKPCEDEMPLQKDGTCMVCGHHNNVA